VALWFLSLLLGAVSGVVENSVVVDGVAYSIPEELIDGVARAIAIVLMDSLIDFRRD